MWASKIAELVDLMEERGVAWIPTLFVYQQIAQMENMPVYARDKAKEIIQRHVAAFQTYFDHNILIGAGSEAGSPLTPHPSVLGQSISTPT